MNELSGAIKNAAIKHKEEINTIKESSKARQVEIEKLKLMRSMYPEVTGGLKNLSYQERIHVNEAFKKTTVMLKNSASMDKINEAARSLVDTYKIQIPWLRRVATGVGSLTGVYDKATGAFRGHTTGLRRSIGALRNNILLVTFAVSGFVATIMSFIKNAAAFDSALTGLTEVAGAMGQNMYKAKIAAEEFAKEGLLTIQEAAAGFKNLISWGLSMDQAKKAMVALTDAAAYNRQGTLSIGEAVVGATQGLKNYISNLLDNAGVTKNISNIEKDYAKSIGTTVEKLTEQQRVQGTYLGLLKESEKFEGNRLRYMKDFQGTLSKMRAVWLQFSATLGKVFLPVAERITRIMFSIMDAIGLMTKEGEINIKAKLVSSFMYLETIVKGLYVTLQLLLIPFKILISFSSLFGSSAEILTNRLTSLAGSLVFITTASWGLARAATFLANTFTKSNIYFLALWGTLILLGEIFFYITKGARDYQEALVKLTETTKQLTDDKILYHRSLLNEQLLNKDVKISNEGVITSYGNIRTEIENTTIALMKYMTMEEQNLRRKDIGRIIEGAPSSSRTMEEHVKVPWMSSETNKNYRYVEETYTKLIDDAKRLSLVNAEIFANAPELASTFAEELIDLTKYMVNVNIGSDEARKTLMDLASQFLQMGDAANLSRKQIEAIQKKISELKDTVSEPIGGKENKTTFEQIFSMLPSFSELKYEDIGSNIVDTIFQVKAGAIDEQADKLRLGLLKGVKDGVIPASTDIRKIVDDFTYKEYEIFMESYQENFIDKVTPSIEKATNEFFLKLESMSKSERKINFILESIGGEAAFKVTLKQIDRQYAEFGKAIEDAENKYLTLGSSFEKEFGISVKQAKAELILRKDIEKSTEAVKEQTRAVNEYYDALERELQLKYEAANLELLEYDRKKQLVEMEIELISRKSVAQAMAMEFALNLHESIYASMEKVSEAFFDHEYRRQMTLAKVVKILLQDQLSFFLQTAAKRIQSKAAEAAIDAAWLVGQAIVYRNPDFLAAAGEMAAVAVGYASLAGTIGGMANRVQSQQVSLPNVSNANEKSKGGSVAGGTQAGSVTSAGQMVVNIRPSTTINGQNIYLGSFGSVSEAGVALGNMEVNIMKQALETGEVDLTRSTRR